MSIKTFLESTSGKWLAIVMVAAVIVVAAWITWNYTGPSAAADISGRMTYVCAETNKPFEFKIQPGMTLPVMSPHSGKATGYPAELCYWTKDGKPVERPTPVLMNDYVKKPGPTFCPECGRLVRFRNPRPGEADVPPTREQYARRRNPEE